MSKRTTFTTITPLPPNVSRESVISFFHNHLEMIDLNPLIKERHPIPVPAHAPPDEQHCIWYSLTDEISYLPGIPAASSNVSYTCAFHDLPDGLQTHCYAPMGLDIRGRWSVGGTLPGEPPERQELGLGAPSTGLYIREDVDIRCNILMTSFVKKTLKKSHAALVEKLGAQAASSQCPDAPAKFSHTLPTTTPSRAPRSRSADTPLPVQSHSRLAYQLGDSHQRNGNEGRIANRRFRDVAHGGASYQQQRQQQHQCQQKRNRLQGTGSFSIPYSQTTQSEPPQMQPQPPPMSQMHQYHGPQFSIANHSTPSLATTIPTTLSSGNRSDIHLPGDVPSPLRIRHKPNGSAGHGVDLLFDRDPKGDDVQQQTFREHPPPRPRYRPSCHKTGQPQRNGPASADFAAAAKRPDYSQDVVVAELDDSRQPPPKRIHELPCPHPAALRPGIEGKVARVQADGRPYPELE